MSLLGIPLIIAGLFGVLKVPESGDARRPFSLDVSGALFAVIGLGGVIVIALVPALIGAGAGRTLSDTLVQGYQPAMLSMAALCVVAALISGVFVRPGAA